MPAAGVDGRQLFDRQKTTTSAAPHRCTPFNLPAHGVLSLNPTETITLTANALFTPECTAVLEDSGVTDFGTVREPFHASVTPQSYATGAATVLAWLLVIMLLIQPRTFFLGGTGGTSGLLGRHGMISGATGGGSVIGVGSRPWLQKIAALTVAVSLTIATADTFKVAEQQYANNYMSAADLRDEVVGSLEIKISRVVSDVFLWLAQVQTLIRLFPRHKEKVIIKWIGFALIILDLTFNCLNSFMGKHPVGRPKRFEDAIPALSYLFQLALSMLYAAWVLYYAVTKRRYAFYHKLMWNISLVALLSFVAILTPVVFFITDISNTSVSGWGDYFRWVGAAAASVIVWEWVERIEALEREERKDGILGQEIFDGDEMLDVTSSEEVSWPRSRYQRYDPNSGRGGDSGGARTSGAHRDANNTTHRGRHAVRHGWRSGAHVPLASIAAKEAALSDRGLLSADSMEPSPATNNSLYASVPTPPPAVASPVSRTDTASAGSTVYTIRYHTVNEPAPPLMRHTSSQLQKEVVFDGQQNPSNPRFPESNDPEHAARKRSRWDAVPNPFKRRKASPPPEVRSAHIVTNSASGQSSQPSHNYPRWDIKSRIGALAAEAGERMRERSTGKQTIVELPSFVIPAQPRGRTWSPDVLQPQNEIRESETDNLRDSQGSGSHSGGLLRGSPRSGDIARSISDNQRAMHVAGTSIEHHHRLPAADSPSRMEPVRELSVVSEDPGGQSQSSRGSDAPDRIRDFSLPDKSGSTAPGHDRIYRS